VYPPVAALKFNSSSQPQALLRAALNLVDFPCKSTISDGSRLGAVTTNRCLRGDHPATPCLFRTGIQLYQTKRAEVLKTIQRRATKREFPL
jgi:hypothetical protein